MTLTSVPLGATTLNAERIRTWRRAATSIIGMLVLYELVARSGYFPAVLLPPLQRPSP